MSYIKHKQYFLEKNLFQRDNIEALANCYANYKILGVFYPEEIMKMIFEIDGIRHTQDKIVNSHLCSKIEDNKNKEEFEYYKPRNLEFYQSLVQFKFINFVKSGFFQLTLDNSNHKSKSSNSNVVEEKNNENKNEPLVSELVLTKDDSDFVQLEKNSENFMNILEGLQSNVGEKLNLFLRLYIDEKFKRNCEMPSRVWIHISASKSKSKVKFLTTTDKYHEVTCQLIFENLVLLAKGTGEYKNKAIDNAIKSFTIECVKIMKADAEPELLNKTTDDDEFKRLNAKMYPHPCLKKFFLKTNNLGSSISILQESFQNFKLCIKYQENEKESLEMLLENQILASIQYETSLQKTKEKLADFVLDSLRKTHYTLEKIAARMEEFKQNNALEKEEMYQKNTKDPTKLDSNKNLGGKMMQKMGWNEGKTLGQKKDAILEPIINEVKLSRSGIGFNFGPSSDVKSFTNNVAKFLTDWANKDEDDLIFDRELNNQERAIIHKECRKRGLMSKSNNTINGERFLVVSKNRTQFELFNWVKNSGGHTKLYRIIEPLNSSK